MAQKRNKRGTVVTSDATVKGPGIVKVAAVSRGTKPALLGSTESYRWLRLQPNTKVHAPIQVYATETADGWRGWPKGDLGKSVRPNTVWLRKDWRTVEPMVSETASAATPVRRKAAAG